MLSGRNITLVVSGSIAAYKSAELIRELTKSGARVRPVMTEGATHFITPLTLQTLSGSPVTTDMFNEAQESEIGHISLADEADAVLVAPATANLIAKIATGLADDVASAAILAAKVPLIIAPAMNVNMWENPVTQENVEKLRRRGAVIVGPGYGDLACGWVGQGRLADIDQIIEAVGMTLAEKDLTGSHVIVTAGPTREAFDPVRFITNRSSGKMGYAIARAAARRGATVTLISGPTNLAVPFGTNLVRVSTALEMREKLFSALERIPDENRVTNFVFMVAAVTDYRPAVVSPTKLKSDKSKGITLELEPNPDIVGELGEKRKELERKKKIGLRLVGFSVETGEVEDMLVSSRGKLQNKGLDLIVANLAEDAFEKDTNRVWLLESGGREQSVSLSDKLAIAERVISAALAL